MDSNQIGSDFFSAPEERSSVEISERGGDILGRPPATEFVFVCSEPGFELDCAVFESRISGGREKRIFLLTKAMAEHLAAREIAKPRTILLYATRSGREGLWPVPRALTETDIENGWISSQREAAIAARKGWVRVVPNLKASRYDLVRIGGDGAPLPTFDLTRPLGERILAAVGAANLVRDESHPFMRRLIDGGGDLEL